MATREWFPNPNLHKKWQLTIRWFPKKHSEHVQATSHDPGNELIQRHLKAQMSHKSAKPKLSTFLQSNQEIKWHPSPSVHVSCHCHFHFFCSKWGAVPRVVGISKQKHTRYYVFKNTAQRKLRSNFCWFEEKNRRFNLAGATKRKPKWSPLVNLSMANTNHAARHIPPGAGHGITKCNGKKIVKLLLRLRYQANGIMRRPLVPCCGRVLRPALPCGEVSHPYKHHWGTDALWSHVSGLKLGS